MKLFISSHSPRVFAGAFVLWFALAAVGYGAGGGVVWTPAKGTFPLSSLLPNGSPWTNIGGVSINDSGEVVGSGSYNGVTSGFKLQLPTGYY